MMDVQSTGRGVCISWYELCHYSISLPIRDGFFSSFFFAIDGEPTDYSLTERKTRQAKQYYKNSE